MRLPLTVDIIPTQFSGGTITKYDSGITNGIVSKKSNGELYVTQRPSIGIFEDCSTVISDAKGRGCYYWSQNSAGYYVNDDTVYKDGYSTSVGTISAGTEKCYFLELEATLLLVDPENDQAWTISTGDTLTQITDVDFPPKQTPAVPLAYGGAVLDGYFFVLGTDGGVYNSDLEDATAWTSTSVIEAERDPDGGVYLSKHHDNIVVLGAKTIEFFYNAANPTASPLNRRQDISYQVGCVNGETVWQNGDDLYFVGVSEAGHLGIYRLKQFGLTKISSDGMDAFLTQAINKDNYRAVGCGVAAFGHTMFILTLGTTPSTFSPETTLVFDDTAGLSYFWSTSLDGQSQFPLMQWSIQNGTSSRYGEGVMSNGDLITINDDMTPSDSIGSITYVVTDYVVDGYITQSGDTGTDIAMKIRTGQWDGGTGNYKFCNYLRLIGDATESSETVTVKTADENSASFSTGNTIDMSTGEEIRRLGRFKRRNHQLEATTTEMLRLEAIEINVKVANG